jgi:hypothetical protein
MRRFLLLVLLASAACAPRQPDANASARADTAPATKPGVRAAAGPNSADAKAARGVAARYFALVKEGDFASARNLWGHGGADSGGDAAALRNSFKAYSSYDVTVGAPTDVHVTDGMQYVNVAAKVRGTRSSTGKVVTLEGPVMLRRSIDPRAADVDSREWTIWGVDIRIPH